MGRGRRHLVVSFVVVGLQFSTGSETSGVLRPVPQFSSGDLQGLPTSKVEVAKRTMQSQAQVYIAQMSPIALAGCEYLVPVPIYSPRRHAVASACLFCTYINLVGNRHCLS